MVQGSKLDNAAPWSRELSENWTFRRADSDEWLPARVPGTVHSDLRRNRKISDPFYRLNEHSLQWIDKAEWEYRTLFEVSPAELDRQNLALCFDGLDTVCTVFLNDVRVLSADNMFRTWQVPCKDQLRPGRNELRVLFHSPVAAGLAAHDAIDYTIPVSPNDLSEIGQVPGGKRVSVFLRKAPYHFGWDWGPRLVTSGIWRAVRLRGWDSVTIDDLYVEQLQLGNTARMTARLELRCDTEISEARVEIRVNDQSERVMVTGLSAGSTALKIPFEIRDPQIWWPNGLGEQPLYTITAEVSTALARATAQRRTGLRTVQLVTNDDGTQPAFYFQVNGQPVFMKGANYIPQDVFLTDVTGERYRSLLAAAKDANMNMIRVWGGGIYENDLFYELCDEMGLLVWQDFMFACAMYPGDDAFLENVRREAVDNVKRLRNHPSLALWCGNNEILTGWKNWGWEKEVVEQQSRQAADIIWQAYQDIFHRVLPGVVDEHDPSRRYWASSPAGGDTVTENPDTGDMHYWGVWWGKERFETYGEIIPAFMSEFGFQSFPEFNSVQKYTVAEDHDIYSEVMKSHQRSSIGNDTIEEYMQRSYRSPRGFGHFLYVSHLLQADGIKSGIEAHRRNRGKCMGSLYWQINDCWPVASWSSIDYYGQRKALHYAVREAFRPLLLSPVVTALGVAVHIVSDLLQDVRAVLEARLLDFDGTEIWRRDEPVTVRANSSNVYLELPETGRVPAEMKDRVVLLVALKNGDEILAENRLFFKPFKELSLPAARLKHTISERGDNIEITVGSNTYARGVFLSHPGMANFSDNYFDLLPGRERTVTIPRGSDYNRGEFGKALTVISLTDSY
jgi:beta-mannosidase